MTAHDERIRDMEMALRVALANVRPDASFYQKKMFGGAGFWVDGLIFAAWFGESLALKLPPDAREALLAIPGTVARTEMGAYVEVPPEWIDDPAALEPWVAQSVDFVKAKKTMKRR
ncbi:MAG: TfoX/Sxy family protein [Anaerolineae bacterium]|nr:TfoX/Sxy family protein [Anaerolineae bacterium]